MNNITCEFGSCYRCGTCMDVMIDPGNVYAYCELCQKAISEPNQDKGE